MRLIDADALIARYGEPCHSFLDVIESMPTIDPVEYFAHVDRIKKCPNCRYQIFDAEPVRHGRWERMDECCNHSKTFRCSVCKGDVEYPYFTRFCEYDYCPNCGAKMDAEVQHD